MKTNSIFGALAVGTLLLGAGATLVWAHGDKKDGHPTKKAAKSQMATVVIDGAYKPATVSVKAGVPTMLMFTLKKDSGCGNTVVIPALKKTLALKVGQTQSVTFTPKKGQTLAFACPMDMFKGKVVAK